MNPLFFAILLALLHSSASESYYVSEECPESVPKPCNSLSGYLEDFSDPIPDSTVLYFTEGNHTLDGILSLHYISNFTMQGIGSASTVRIHCTEEGGIYILGGNLVTFKEISFHNYMEVGEAYGITVVDSINLVFTKFSVHGSHLFFNNSLNVLVSFSTFHNSDATFEYDIVERNESDDIPSYYLNVTDVHVNALTPESGIFLLMYNGDSYFLRITFNNIVIVGSRLSNNSAIDLWYSLYTLCINNMTSSGGYSGTGIVLHVDTGNAPFNRNELGIEFLGNSALGDVYEIAVIENSRFYNNRYGVVIIGSLDSPFDSRDAIHIKSCDISDNTVSGFLVVFDDGVTAAADSIITVGLSNSVLRNNDRNIIGNINTAFFVNVTITGTRNSGLTLESAHIFIIGNLNFINNRGENGGALVLHQNSRLVLHEGSIVNVTGNRATVKGGGIYNDVVVQSTLEALALYLQVDATYYFSNNSAGVVGHDIYNIPTICLYYSCTSSLGNNAVRQSTDSLELCYCNESIDYHLSFNHTRDCFKTIPKQYLFPGQRVKFSILMLGFDTNLQFNSITDGTIRAALNGDPATSEDFSIDPKCSTRYYTYSSESQNVTENEMAILINYENIVSELLQPNVVLRLNFTVNPCPIGFSLSNGKCNCSSGLRQNNISCDINTLSITHQGQFWIGSYYPIANASHAEPESCIIGESCFIFCSRDSVTFTLNDTDAQCVNNRSGRLCGGCRDGYSLLMGSNNCGKCNNSLILLGWIPLFGIMGILLVVMLIVLNLTVSVGTLNGLLFYANVIKLYEPVLSPEGVAPVLHQILSWINLDFGVETCLYNGMDRYAKEWLQFLFPAYLWLIIIVIIMLGKCDNRISRLVSTTRNAVPVLATLMLLSYTKIVRTCIFILQRRSVTLHCTNDSTRSISLWFEDPTVHYGAGKHGALLTLALLVIVFFIVPYTIFLLFNQLIEKYLSGCRGFSRIWNHLKPVIDAYCGPLKDNYRFWPGLFVASRLPVLVYSSFVNDYNTNRAHLLSGILTVVVILLTLAYSLGGVYRKGLNNFIEAWFLLNLSMVIAFTFAFASDEGSSNWFNVWLIVFELSFVIVIIYHVYLKLRSTKWFEDAMEKLNAYKKKVLKEKVPAADTTVPTIELEEKETFEAVISSSRRMVTSSIVDLDHCDRESVVDLFTE
uniref:Right handed beta helix domain-containing protein n=1 Tax=Amphimedon queenslandica TaxID=400682 RepID=A0A1X7VHB2_AMPQE